MSKLRIGVIGTGHLGRIHTKLWSENTTSQLTGVYDAINEKAKAVADEFSTLAYSSLEELCSNVDAVTIAASTTSHYEIADFCINHGIHCLIEKPITSTYEQSQKLIELAKNKKVILQVGHVERFNPAILAAKKYNIEPKFIETHRLSQFKPRATDVSVIHDLMIHDIDILLWMAKSPVKSIDANGVNVLTETTDIANARLTFENGAVANITASRISAKPMRKMRIFQKDMYLSIDFGLPELEIFRILDEEETISDGTPATMLGSINQGLKNKNIYYQKPEIVQINAISEEQYAFAESITKGNPVPVRADEAAEALRIAEIIEDHVKNTSA
jgi:predicted dehydrogenase